ncbi:MAG: DUF4215 domain-containing protein [Myxococcota bacterium]|nr:DUF4215 domain-containing protein [Myxococcota bacterium]
MNHYLSMCLIFLSVGCLPEPSENRTRQPSAAGVEVGVPSAGKRSAEGALGGTRGAVGGDDRSSAGGDHNTARGVLGAGGRSAGVRADDVNRAGATEGAGAAGTVADGMSAAGSDNSGSIEDCLRIDRITEPMIFPPAGLRVGFRLLDCDGAPVRPIETTDVTVLDAENGDVFGAQGNDAGVRFGRPTQLGLFTAIVLDLSESAFEADAVEQIVSAARRFITEKVADQLANARHTVMLLAFGRTTQIEVLQDFTQDANLLYSALDELDTSTPRGPADLYNAYTQALVRVGHQGRDREMVSRFVVLLTAGRHLSGNDQLLRTQALATKASIEASIHGIAMPGAPDFDRLSALATRAQDFLSVDAVRDLDDAIGTVMDRVGALARSHYVVGACTTRSGGTPSVTIQVNLDEASAETTVPYSAERLTGAVMDCDLNRIVSDDPPVCVADARRCDGQILVACNALGTSESRTDCSTLPGLCLNGACALTICGDGRLDPLEECDDGNDIPGDACTNQCTRPRCGDGVIQRFEECDDGNTMTETCEYGLQSCTVCAENCLEQAGESRFCGDEILDEEHEECDDGNTMNGDGCDSNCTQQQVYADCVDVLHRLENPESGRYAINPDDGRPWQPFEAQCEMELDGGGWTLVAVISDDGQDSWTWNRRSGWYGDGIYFGSLDEAQNDYRSRAHDRVIANDILFVHAPSRVWAAYHDVQRGERPHAALYESGSRCYGGRDPQGLTMSAGSLRAGNGLCSTDLFISPLEQDGTATCNTDAACARGECGTFGPAWSHGISGDGCPLDDPQHSGLGPHPGDRADEENPVLGFANALGLNENAPGTGVNQMRIYVRRSIGSRCGNGLVEAGEECDDGDRDDFDTCSNVCRRVPASGGDAGSGGAMAPDSAGDEGDFDFAGEFGWSDSAGQTFAEWGGEAISSGESGWNDSGGQSFAGRGGEATSGGEVTSGGDPRQGGFRL